MAYIGQDKKALLAPAIKAVLAKYGMKGSIKIQHHATLIVTVKSGKLDLLAQAPKGHLGYYEPNKHWLTQHGYTGDVLAFFQELYAAMMEGNHDRSDIQSDYFDVGWYAYVHVGDYNTHFVHTA